MDGGDTGIRDPVQFVARLKVPPHIA